MSDWIHLDFSVITGETDKAFCLVLEDGEEVWLPKSQIADADRYARGDRNGTISITSWLADQKGLGQ